MRKKIAAAGGILALSMILTHAPIRHPESTSGHSLTAQDLTSEGPVKTWNGQETDICSATTEKIRPSELYLMGKSVEPTQVITGTIPTQETNYYPPQKSDSKYAILLIPANFTTDAYQGALSLVKLGLDAAYRNLPVEFIPYEQNTHADINVYHPYPALDKEDLERLTSIAQDHADTFLLIVNNEESFGGARIGKHGVISGTPDFILYRAIHEVAHQLGLRDQYMKTYSKTDLVGPQLFLPDTELDELVIEAMKNSGSEFHKTNYTCGGDHVYTFDSESNIMREVMSNEDIVDRITHSEPIFSDFQIHYMNAYIQKKLLRR